MYYLAKKFSVTLFTTKPAAAPTITKLAAASFITILATAPFDTPLAAAPVSQTMAEKSETENAEDSKFASIYSSEWRWRQKLLAVNEDSQGDEVPAHLPDVSFQNQRERLATWQRVLKEMAAIDRKKLSLENQINFSVYKAQIDALMEQQKFRLYEKPLTSDTSFWDDLKYTARKTFHTRRDYENYLSQLGEFPRYFTQQIENMRAGLKRGFTPPQISLQGRDAAAASVVEVERPQDSVFYTPFKKMPPLMAKADKVELRARAVAAIREKVIPAHAKLLAFLREDYIPGAQTSIAAYDLPDGKNFYRQQIIEYTTLDISPEKIHRIGLEEVAKIRTRMRTIMDEVKFTGKLPAFLNFLRTDPQFYTTEPQQLLNRAAWIAKRFDANAKDWFGRLPRSRFAIKPVPDDIAPYYTAGRGGPGVYLVNTYDLPSRPLYSLPALTLHESAPGHAFQMPLAAENKTLPEFRRNTYISAYGEGWALYAEKLGEEMGIYETPYELFGMLSYQMWRACRLVVDTGIHAKGWSRGRAQQFLADNTALSRHEITTEVDRYIAWPGQALSYYLGQLAIEKARARAQATLGKKFDIRAFHDTILELGSVPLPVLEARVERFIAEGGVGPYPDQR